MEKEEFEKYVNEGIDAIPEEFLKLLDNVGIFIEDYPSPEQRHKLFLREGWTLFGLYEGIPQTKRGTNYAGVLPDRITIFRGPILAASQTPEDIKTIVKDTVWHEIAHHFGMNEAEVRAAEARRGRHSH